MSEKIPIDLYSASHVIAFTVDPETHNSWGRADKFVLSRGPGASRHFQERRKRERHPISNLPQTIRQSSFLSIKPDLNQGFEEAVTQGV